MKKPRNAQDRFTRKYWVAFFINTSSLLLAFAFIYLYGETLSGWAAGLSIAFLGVFIEHQVMKERNYPPMISDARREEAIAVLAKNGLQAHLYIPAAGCDDEELAETLRFMGDSGYLITNACGEIYGRVAKAAMTSDERANMARQGFYLVERNTVETP
ncbi:hypothetical protein EIP75_21670 [Aquabacterium soli]|uniref:Uncharacterized protein n=1 Tax=Aquabacterium soli TaxID=2493092 RepID=A0A426V2V3_9BURK|nr:hypothetical protein [Aquabacterium soli]RRS01187.1 hypothetical protein EIP75_21670 [Aquabacterium soli]